MLSFRNGDMMPALGLGTWKSRPGEVYDAIREAIKIGYRHFDCAFIYENEKEIGQALTDAISDGEVSRNDLWITSKLWCDVHARADVIPALKGTLADLKLEYLDLYLIHWPIAFQKGIKYPRIGSEFISLDDMPLEETWAGMEDAVNAGLTRHIGVSNFSIKKLKQISASATIKPEMDQVEMHPLLQQSKLVSFCHAEGIHVTAYSPLGSPDRHPSIKGKDEPSLLEHPVITKIAERNNCSTGQVLIQWAMARGTAVIPKSVNPGRLKQNFDAAGISLSDKDMADINAMDRHFRYLEGGIWTIEGSPYTKANLWDE